MYQSCTRRRIQAAFARLAMAGMIGSVSLQAGGCTRHAASTSAASAGPIAPVTAAVSQPADRKTFESSTKGFHFDYPSTWQQQQQKGDAVVILVPFGARSNGSRTITVTVPDLPPHIPGLIPLNLVENGFIDDVRKNYKNLAIVENGPRTMTGAQAKLLKATGKDDTNADAVIEALVVVHKDQVLIIEAEDDPAGADPAKSAMDMIMGSLTWTK